MSRRPWWGLLVLIILVSMSGCGQADVHSHQPTGGQPVTNDETTLAFQTLDEKSFTPALKEKADELKQLEKEGTEILHDPKHTFILIALGPRNTAGYEIRVHQVVKKGNSVTIQASEITPPPEGFAAQVLTHPIVAVQIPPDPSIKDAQIQWQ